MKEFNIWHPVHMTKRSRYCLFIRHSLYKLAKLAACVPVWFSQVWSLNTNKPIHNQRFDSYCYTLAWRPNGKIGDGIEDTRKMQENFNFAW
jgi:hypothetical protein